MQSITYKVWKKKSLYILHPQFSSEILQMFFMNFGRKLTQLSNRILVILPEKFLLQAGNFWKVLVTSWKFLKILLTSWKFLKSFCYKLEISEKFLLQAENFWKVFVTSWRRMWLGWGAIFSPIMRWMQNTKFIQIYGGCVTNNFFFLIKKLKNIEALSQIRKFNKKIKKGAVSQSVWY